MVSSISMEYKQFSNRFIWYIDRAITSTTTPDQRNLGVMAMKEYSTLQKSRIGVLYYEQPFFAKSYPHWREYSQCILSS